MGVRGGGLLLSGLLKSIQTKDYTTFEVDIMYRSVIYSALSVCDISDALAVMSVDLGNEFMKVAIVKPGVPMEIAINKSVLHSYISSPL